MVTAQKVEKLKIKDKEVEQVEKFKYLRVIIQNNRKLCLFLGTNKAIGER